MSRTLAMLAVCLLALTTAGGAFAVTIEQQGATGTQPLDSMGWLTHPISIQQFNPSLGSLNKVTLYISGTITSSYYFRNTTSQPHQAEVWQRGIYWIDDGTSTLVSVESQQRYISMGLYPGQSDQIVGATSSNSRSADITQGMGYFTGSGTCALNVKGRSDSRVSDYGMNHYSYDRFGSLSWKVTYDYTPVVPEPGGLLALSGGVLPLIAILRRKRS